MELPEMPEGSGFVGIGVSAVAALLALRRKIWKDNVEVSRDKAEVHIIESLQKERDQALAELAQSREREREAWQIRADAAKLIGELTAQVRHQSDIIATLEQRVVGLQREMQDLRTQLTPRSTP